MIGNSARLGKENGADRLFFLDYFDYLLHHSGLSNQWAMASTVHRKRCKRDDSH